MPPKLKYLATSLSFINNVLKVSDTRKLHWTCMKFSMQETCASLWYQFLCQILERASQGSVSKQLLRSGVIILYCYSVCPVMAEVISKLAVRRGLKAAEPSTVRHFVFFYHKMTCLGGFRGKKWEWGKKVHFEKRGTMDPAMEVSGQKPLGQNPLGQNPLGQKPTRT